MLQPATAVVNRATSRVTVLTAAQMLQAVLPVLADQATRPVTAVELPVTSHVTALSTVGWMEPSAISVDARVTSLVTARTLLQLADSKVDQADFRVDHRLVATVELEDSVTVRCSAIAAEDTDT
jgi:hypothetical protein